MRILFAVLIAALVGCVSEEPQVMQATGSAPTDTVRLYRTSVADTMKAFHVATFDAPAFLYGARYNAENCEIARRLFQSQPGVQVRYWCS